MGFVGLWSKSDDFRKLWDLWDLGRNFDSCGKSLSASPPCIPKLKFEFWCNPIWATRVSLKVLPVSNKVLQCIPSPIKGYIAVVLKRIRSTYKGDDV